MPASYQPAPGPIGRNLIRAVEQLKDIRGLSWRRLSAELERLGRPIVSLGLTRMTRGERRIDVDELVALAVALGVNPPALLLPRDTAADQIIELTPHVRARAADAWAWMDGRAPLPDQPPDGKDGRRKHWEAADFLLNARPVTGADEYPPLLFALKDLVSAWEVVYQDWANPDTYAQQARSVARDLQRVGLMSEEEIERLATDGRAAQLDAG